MPRSEVIGLPRPGQQFWSRLIFYFMLMMIWKFNDILWQRRPLTSFDSCCFTHFLSRRSSVCWRSVGIIFILLPLFSFLQIYFICFFYSNFLSQFFLFLEGIILFSPSNGCLILFHISTFLLYFIFYFFTRFSTHGTMYNYAVAHSYIQTYNDVVYTWITVIQLGLSTAEIIL